VLFQFITAARMKTITFWYIAQCSLVEVDRRLRATNYKLTCLNQLFHRSQLLFRCWQVVRYLQVPYVLRSTLSDVTTLSCCNKVTRVNASPGPPMRDHCRSGKRRFEARGRLACLRDIGETYCTPHAAPDRAPSNV
jgi:hypothetical protein